MYRSLLQKLYQLFREHTPASARRGIRIALFICSCCLSYGLALGVRFDFDVDRMYSGSSVAVALFLLIGFRLASLSYFGLLRNAWRYASIDDLLSLIKAHATSSVLLAAGVLLTRVPHFARSILFIEFIFSLALNSAILLLIRLAFERLSEVVRFEGAAKMSKVVVLGGGYSGHFLVKSLLGNRRIGYHPAAILDDSVRLHNTSIHGVPVVGSLSNLAHVVSITPDVEGIIVAIPSLSATRCAEIQDVCNRCGVFLKRLQSFDDIAVGSLYGRGSEVSLELALQKAVQTELHPELLQELANKVVLVTGAGGSIGSEICRQLAHIGVSRLVMLDNCEYNLFRIDGEIAQRYPLLAKESLIVDVRDQQRLDSVIAAQKPNAVYHAAAYKHVPLLEHNPYEAFYTNVVGTLHVQEACLRHRVKRFVLISTDKAVKPSNTMGISKHLAERVVKSLSLSERNDNTHSMIVRFGNVINSSGSVIPIFREQILSGGPITVTHPDMERYFMSIPEAVKLVLSASVQGANGQVYVLDMGTRVKIVDLARKMLALYGRMDVPIVFTGLRPGESITEDLIADHERLEPSDVKGISVVIAREPTGADPVALIKDAFQALREDPAFDVGAFMREQVMQ